MDERSQKLQEFKKRLRKRIDSKPKITNAVWREPRYDDIYFEGVEYLDAIARGEIDG